MIPGRLNLKIYKGSSFDEVIRWESANKTYATIYTISKAAPCVVTLGVGEPLPPVHWRVRINNVIGMKEINLASDQYYITSSVDSLANKVTFNEINSAGFTAYTSGGILEWNTPVTLTGYSAQMQIRESIDSPTYLIELTSNPAGMITNSTTFNTISGTRIVGAGTYTAVASTSSGTGTGATFTVTTTGSDTNYNGSTTISIVNPGQGYAVGDIITIAGGLLGGNSPINNLSFILGTSVSQHGGIVINDINSTISISLTAAQTSALNADVAIYSMELSKGAQVDTFLTGNVTLIPEITR